MRTASLELPRCFALLCVLTLFLDSLCADEKPLAELMPRIPPRTPAEALKTFRLQHGFSLELVAAEPDVVDPIDAAFDERGRMYVVEMNDYPFLPEQRVEKYREQRPETWGRIRLLTDVDGDGRMDRSVVFADKLRWPQSVCCARGGVFVIAPPHLYFMRDTDGDDVADQREIICTGFNSTNVQALANGLEWGRDNAIYFSSGIAGGDLTVPARDGRPETKFTPGRRDLRLDPQTFGLTMVAGGQQFGHTIDDWGNRFICSNSSHIVHVTWPLPALERNPLLAIPELTRAIAKEGAAAVVFRTSTAEPWRLVRTARRAADPEMRKRLPPTELVPIGFFTSATGITVYRGGAYPPEFQGNVLIGDCGGNLVHRKTLQPDGISFLATRAEEQVEFLTSTDNWFRPVNFVNAPDGTLYILDMYRETIEHPFSIPDDIKALVDLESGYDKGRIWRLVPPNYHRMTPPNLAEAADADLVQQLRSPHGWVRDTAQRLLVERKAVATAGSLQALLRDANVLPVTRMHVLWTLQGLGKLRLDDVAVALEGTDGRLKEHALRLIPEVLGTDTGLDSAILKLVDDPSPRVRWQLALTLGDLPERLAVPGLKRLALRTADVSDLRIAWLSSCSPYMTTLAVELVAADTEQVRPLLVELARLSGSAANSSGAVQLLTATVQESVSDRTQTAVLLALDEGLRRRGTRLSGLVAMNAIDDAVKGRLAERFERARVAANDPNTSEPDRLTAINLLGLSEAQQTLDGLRELMTAQTPPALQQAVIRVLSGTGSDAAYAAIVDAWKGFGPSARREAVDDLIQTNNGSMALLSAIESGQIKASQIERDKRQFLVTHRQPAIQERAQRLLAEPTSSRKQVVADYQSVLELSGDAERGRMLFAKTCVQCHRIGTAGHQVGPDLVSVQNKSPADLLVAILDPNREAQPSFQTYTVVTHEGKTHTGIVSAETAASLTLKRAEAKEDVVLRETVDELVANGISLMPEGLEKDFDRQQLADVIAAIKSLQAP